MREGVGDRTRYRTCAFVTFNIFSSQRRFGWKHIEKVFLGYLLIPEMDFYKKETFQDLSFR